MASYHITPNGPRACSTTPDRCLYSREENAEHYDNVAEAQASYEKIMEAKHGLAGVSRAASNRETDLYGLYEKLDSLERDNEQFKKIARLAAYSRAAPSKNPRAPHRNTGRGRGHERMRRVRKSVSTMAVRGGKELFKSVGPTPKNIVALHGYLTREVEEALKR